MNADDIFVAHIGSSIMFTGTKAECEVYRSSRDYSTSSWRINDIENYGDDCYSEGYDNGHNAGYDEGSND